MLRLSPASQRILKSAKALFAARGFEHAGTSAIARAAGTSESQLVKHFGSKLGVLEAIFTEGWKRIAVEAQAQADAVAAPAEKLRAIAEVVFAVLAADPELKALLLLEARRVRREGSAVTLTEGYYGFVSLLDGIFGEMQSDGLLRPGVHPQAARSALFGMLEGMARDQLLSDRMGLPAPYGPEGVSAMLELLLGAMVAPPPAEDAGV